MSSTLNSPSIRSALPAFALLALLLAATRINHFGLLPDASWAVFFLAGSALRSQLRWAFPALMAIAVAVDAWVISGTGQSFWTHYCISPGYWALLPAYFSMSAGGAILLALAERSEKLAALALLPVLLLSVMICHLLAQGGFYWLSNSVADPTLAGWWKNYSDWLPAYAQTSVMYVAAATVLYAGLRAAGGITLQNVRAGR